MSKFLSVLASLLIASWTTGCDSPGPDASLPAAVTALPNPSRPDSAQANLSTGPQGQVVLSWVEALDTGGHALRYTTWTGRRWGSSRSAATGDNWFVNWADFPSVVPISKNLLAAHWLERQPAGGYAYDIRLAVSDDDGASWGSPISPHNDGTATEHGFVSLMPWRSSLAALWLDGRNMPGNKPDDTAGMSLRFAGINNAGVAADTVSEETVVDDLVCDCCQTDVALSSDGPIAIYRNRTTEEIRDIFVVRAVDEQWQAPQALADDGWQIAGCPVNGPSIAAQNEHVVAAWFTASNDVPRVRFARSDNAGRTFKTPLDIDATSPMGRVAVVLLDNGDAAVSWLRQTDSDSADFCVRLVAADGSMGPVRVVAKTAASRPTGFPQLARSDMQLLFAWTSIDNTGDATSGGYSDDKSKSLRTATAPIAWLR